MALLREIRSLPGHTFWTDDVSPADPKGIAFDSVVGYRQITDAHLLTLAIRNGGRLSTFDKGVPDLLPSGEKSVVELIP
jgi:predicted nucleic acid-binding protein